MKNTNIINNFSRLVVQSIKGAALLLLAVLLWVFLLLICALAALGSIFSSRTGMSRHSAWKKMCSWEEDTINRPESV
jgi:hypothetical protein